jgi:hypothetical protein
MRHLSLIASIFLTLILSAHATSVELPITPGQLDQGNYKFSVAANATTNGVAFHVIITAKKDEIAPGSEAKLAIVVHPKDRRGVILGTSFKPFLPIDPIAFQKDKHAWTVDFTLPRESLKTPDLCLIFSEQEHRTVDGPNIALLPSVTFYEVKLKDFVKP